MPTSEPSLTLTRPPDPPSLTAPQHPSIPSAQYFVFLSDTLQPRRYWADTAQWRFGRSTWAGCSMRKKRSRWRRRWPTSSDRCRDSCTTEIGKLFRNSIKAYYTSFRNARPITLCNQLCKPYAIFVFVFRRDKNENRNCVFLYKLCIKILELKLI